MPLAGMLAHRFGVRGMVLTAGVVLCAVLPALAAAGSVPALVAALLVFGAAVGAVDCTVNLQAVVVERAAGRSPMSSFHGLFSVGGIAGAGRHGGAGGRRTGTAGTR